MNTVELLWRAELPPPARRGRPPRLTLEGVIAAGITVADLTGGPEFSLRAVGDQLGVPVMTLYSYVESKDQLLDLMVDQCRATMTVTRPVGDWRQRLRQVAADNLALMLAHPWLAMGESERAILGPGTLAKYERELAVVEPLALPDTAKDAVLTLVLDFVRASARAQTSAARERATETPQQWWEREGAQLAALGVEHRFPLASRIGTAVGQATQAAHDAAAAYRFGLEVILDGIAAQLSDG